MRASKAGPALFFAMTLVVSCSGDVPVMGFPLRAHGVMGALAGGLGVLRLRGAGTAAEEKDDDDMMSEAEEYMLGSGDDDDEGLSSSLPPEATDNYIPSDDSDGDTTANNNKIYAEGGDVPGEKHADEEMNEEEPPGDADDRHARENDYAPWGAEPGEEMDSVSHGRHPNDALPTQRERREMNSRQ